jgi:UDP-N-acetylglucosamine 2-epimerase (non-hydrolysing)
MLSIINVEFDVLPEVIKIAPVIQELNKSTKFVVTTIFTGQHAEIIHPFLTLFNINVDIWFNNTLEKGQSLNMLAAKPCLYVRYA